MSGNETNTYEDLEVVHGADLVWTFQVEPLDATGATARIVFATLGTFAVTLTVLPNGAFKFTQFSLTVPAATTANWVPGLYHYDIFVTFSNGQVLPYGTGNLLVK